MPSELSSVDSESDLQETKLIRTKREQAFKGVAINKKSPHEAGFLEMIDGKMWSIIADVRLATAAKKP